MATTTKTRAATSGSRDHDLRKLLEGRRGELMREVQGRIRDARTDITKERQVLDQGESSEVDVQEDIEFALIQMKAETLNNSTRRTYRGSLPLAVSRSRWYEPGSRWPHSDRWRRFHDEGRH
jgi:hypothetical protein